MLGVTLVCSELAHRAGGEAACLVRVRPFHAREGRGRVVTELPALVGPDGLDRLAAALHPGEPCPGDDDQADAGGDVEPEVVSGSL